MPRSHPGRSARGRLGRTRAMARAAVLLVATAAVLVPALPGGAAETTTVKVDPRRVYTPTPVTVRKGDTVAITATGTVAFGAGPIANLGPEGIAWGRRCTAIANPEHRQIPWPAPGSSCWSLIAQVGVGRPVEIGTSATFKAANAGRLQLGVNDNYVEDNSGSFTAQVGVTPAGSGGPTGPSGTGGGTTDTGAAGGSTGTASSRNTGLFVVIGAVVVLAAALLLFLLRRRRKPDDDAEVVAPPQPIVAPVVAAAPPPPPPVPEPVRQLRASRSHRPIRSRSTSTSSRSSSSTGSNFGRLQPLPRRHALDLEGDAEPQAGCGRLVRRPGRRQYEPLRDRGAGREARRP